MQEVAIAPELSKAPETTPTWHQPTLTIIEAATAESGSGLVNDGSTLS